MTTRTGPSEVRAIRPNESSSVFLPERVVAIPTPRAKINGTVIVPADAPPASNDKGTKDGLT